MAAIEPTTVRLSESFLLSDFMGCDSVYRYGYPNPIYDSDLLKMLEGTNLADTIDRIQEYRGPISIAYGYICPELSRKVVHYQSPDKPSYHRWDDGAAADLCFHVQRGAPIYSAFKIDERETYSRMITYAESRMVCFATKVGEMGGGRRAFYENRYMGVRQPQHVKYSSNQTSRDKAKTEHELEHDWRGQGHPSYHGKGRLQFQHTHVGQCVLLSDLLYKAEYVHKGIKNLPPLTQPLKLARFNDNAKLVGDAISEMVELFATRFSIVHAYERRGTSNNWEEEGASFTIVPPRSLSDDPMNVAHQIEKRTAFKVIGVRKVCDEITRIKCHVKDSVASASNERGFGSRRKHTRLRPRRR